MRASAATQRWRARDSAVWIPTRPSDLAFSFGVVLRFEGGARAFDRETSSSGAFIRKTDCCFELIGASTRVGGTAWTSKTACAPRAVSRPARRDQVRVMQLLAPSSRAQLRR